MNVKYEKQRKMNKIMSSNGGVRALVSRIYKKEP